MREPVRKSRSSLLAVALAFVGTAVAGCTIGDVESDDATSSAVSSSDNQDESTAERSPRPTVSEDKPKPDEPKHSQKNPGGELSYDGSAAIAVAGVKGAGQTAVAPWSTMKVPIAIAALRRSPGMEATAKQAIQNSDNAAAEELWGALGTPEQAAAVTSGVIKEGSSTARVESQVVRPGFSSFGQSDWSLSDQAEFASHLRCIRGAEPVVAAMGNIVNGGGYGLGTIPGAIFKGGWGPSSSGGYGVRQFGLIPKSDGKGYVAVAIAVESPDGSYEVGQAELTTAAEFLQSRVDDLPAAAC